MQTGQYPLVDYHNRNPRGDEPQDPRTDWRNGTRVPEPRSPQGDRDAGRSNEGWPASGGGPWQSNRDYTDHGYWEDRHPIPAPGTAGRAIEAGHTGSWRADPRETPAPPATVPAGFGFDGDDRDYPAVLWWTAIWYAVPLVLYTLWAAIMSSSSMRSHALSSLVSDALPGLFALAISIGLAAWVRRISLSWRAITLGFGAAAVGAGLANLLISAF